MPLMEAGLFAILAGITKFRSNQDLTKVIEKRISEELVSALRENLDLKLKQEGIAANLKISVRN